MRIVIDTDPAMGSLGGDPEDSLAILLALRSPELRVDAITTFPEETEKPIISEVTNRRQVINLAVFGETDELSLRNRLVPEISYRCSGFRSVSSGASSCSGY